MTYLSNPLQPVGSNFVFFQQKIGVTFCQFQQSGQHFHPESFPDQRAIKLFPGSTICFCLATKIGKPKLNSLSKLFSGRVSGGDNDNFYLQKCFQNSFRDEYPGMIMTISISKNVFKKFRGDYPGAMMTISISIFFQNCFIGEYPGVIMTIVLRRKINYHLLQVFMFHFFYF